LAALQPDGSIVQKLAALRAKGRVDMVMALAVTTNHHRNRLSFPGQTLGDKALAASFAFFRRWPQAKGFGGFHISQLTQSSHTSSRVSLIQVKAARN
jgi:hypothetical protein